MNYKNHTIFGEKKEDFSLNKTFVFINNQGQWCFEKDKKYYNLAPSEITRASLPPIAAGADQLIKNGCSLKNISYEKGVYIVFSEEEFLNYDVKLEYNDQLFDGWLYNVQSDKIKVDRGQKIWACNYLNLYYKDPPRTLYLKLESC